MSFDFVQLTGFDEMGYANFDFKIQQIFLFLSLAEDDRHTFVSVYPICCFFTNLPNSIESGGVRKTIQLGLGFDPHEKPSYGSLEGDYAKISKYV